MFELFTRNSTAVEAQSLDRNLMRERIAEALRDGGLDPDGRSFSALFKLLSDDLDWYFEQAGEDRD